MHPQDSRVIAYFSLSLVTRIHMIYVKILLSILFGRVCNDNTEERKKIRRITSCDVSGHDADHAVNTLSKYL